MSSCSGTAYQAIVMVLSGVGGREGFQGSAVSWRSCGKTCSIGPSVTMMRASAALAEWNPQVRLMMRWRLTPSAFPKVMRL